MKSRALAFGIPPQHRVSKSSLKKNTPAFQSAVIGLPQRPRALGRQLVALVAWMHTTSDTIAMFNVIAEARPTWILQMLGTNDARRHGRMTGARMVSPAETARNPRDLQRLVQLETNARSITITPPMDATVPVQVVEPTGDRWNAADVEQIAEIVRTMEGTSIDVYTDVARPGLATLLLPDGIHPSLAGQRAIVASVVRHLADELL
jgi:lysophospholipase L1-like esterase